MKAPRSLLLPAAAAALAALLFLPSLNHDFIGFDDGGHLYANPCLQPPTWGNAGRFWTEPYNNIYMPLVFTLWSGLAAAAAWKRGAPVPIQEIPGVFHAANTAVHALNCVLVFELLLALSAFGDPAASKRRRSWAAFAGAMLFAWHPLHVEPVAWASGMKDLLSGFFFLLSLRVYIAFARRGFTSKPLYVGTLALFGLSMAAKPSAVTWPFVVLALDLWVLGRSRRNALIWAAVALALALPFASLNGLMQSTEYTDGLSAPWTRPLIALDSLAFYLWKAAVPLRLGLDYGRTPRFVMESGRAYATWLLPAAVLAAILRFSGRGVLLAGAAVFAAGILPVSGLAAFQHQRFSTVADRYAYLSILGASMALAWALERAPKRRAGLAAGVTGLGLLVLGILSERQLAAWRDSASVYRQALLANPSSVIFNTSLGGLLWREGRFRDAEARYRDAIAARPGYLPAHESLGALYLAQGRLDEAETEFRTALAGPDPLDVATGQVLLARAAAKRGRAEEALRRDMEALRLNPRSVEALDGLADVFADRGEKENAARFRRLAQEARPVFVCRQGPLARFSPWPSRARDSRIAE